MNKLTLCYPLEVVHIGQRFGENQLAAYKEILKLAGHNGLDMRAVDGTPVYATHDGEITFAGEDGSAGLGVVIRTLEQFEYNGQPTHFKSIYWHLKRGSIIVTVNQKVKKGEKIGEADNTGMSTGSHLHFGLKPTTQGEQSWQWFNLEQNNGYNGAIDPLGYFDGTFPNKQPEPILTVKTPFLDMQQAILAFQLSEGITYYKDKPLASVRYGPTTLSKAKKYLK